jgi:hypothetical protein
MQRQSLTDPRPGLTKRQTEVLERLERGTSVKRIAGDIGVTPAAVYQTIDRLRRDGHLPEAFTPSGGRRRRGARHEGGQAPMTPAPAGPSRMSDMRDWDDEDGHAELIEAAIAAGDAPALAYCLGRVDAAGENGLRRRIIEAALRRLGLLGADEADRPEGPNRKRGKS